MDDYQRAVGQVLIAGLWADGEIADEELATLADALDALDLSFEERDEILQSARNPIALRETRVEHLSADERRRVFNHAFFMIMADRKVEDGEGNFLKSLLAHLGFEGAEAKALLFEAAEDTKVRRLAGVSSNT